MQNNSNRAEAARTESEKAGNARISMHDNVDICDDCCSCAAEPYWIQAMKGQDPQSEQKNKDK